MKIVLIIYIVSWIILLAIYAACRIERRFSDSSGVQYALKRPFSYYLLLFLFAPLLMLYLPYIIVRTFIQHRKDTMDVRERMQREKRLQEIAFERYKNAVNSSSSIITEEFINVAEKFQILASSRSYSEIIVCLGKLSLQADSFLLPMIGGNGRVCVYTNNVFECDIWKYITVEDSCMGAWQAYLLGSTLQHQRGVYDDRSYIYSENSIARIKFFGKEPEALIAEIRNFNHSPDIVKDGCKYYISCCYWNNWSGLIRELVEIAVKHNKVIEITDIKTDNLIKYHCGVFF